MKFYSHNYVVLYSEIFYLWFYDFSTSTILAVILRFLYGKIQVRFYDPSFRIVFQFVSKSRFWQPCVWQLLCLNVMSIIKLEREGWAIFHVPSSERIDLKYQFVEHNFRILILQANILRMFNQFQLFEQYQQRVRAIVGADRSRQLVNGALVLITLGGNDFVNNYFLTPFAPRRRQFSLPDYCRYLVQEYRKVLMVIIFTVPSFFILFRCRD